MMRKLAWGIVATFLWLPREAVAQECPPAGSYEGFLVNSVSVETPLRFPLRWVERSLLGRAIDSLQPIAANLPLKQGQPFSGVKHTFSIKAISDAYSSLRPGERVKLAVVIPYFLSCDTTARAVDVVYRVYSTEAAYFASRLLEIPQDVPARELTIGTASERDGKVLPLPFVSYNSTSRLFGGISTSWHKKGTILNSVRAMGGGSSSSYRASFSVGGSYDRSQGPLSHIEWNVGARATSEPAGPIKLQESIGKAEFLGATRAYGKFATLVRFGGAFEGGTVSSSTATPELVSTSRKRSIKSYVGGTWSHNRQRWEASYAFEIAKATDATPVDFRKQVVDFAHEVRLLPREHWPIQLNTHGSAGWIAGDAVAVPVSERFFGGNVVSGFVKNPMWTIAAGPLIRSFPQNALNAVNGQPIGGTSFTAVNFTAALPAWGIPAMPSVIRNAKPLADGIHLGLQAAQAESRKDYLARTRDFGLVLTRAEAVVPDLENAKNQLLSLANRDLPGDLKDELNDLVVTYIDDGALVRLRQAQKATRSGLAWDACRFLAGADPDTFPLAHLHRNLKEVVAPALTTANLAAEARSMRELADRFDLHRHELATLIDPIARSAVVDVKQLEELSAPLADVAAHAIRLNSAIDALGSRPDPIGTLAFTASEWSRAVVTIASPAATTDPSDRLYDVTRLALGIGQLVPPQIGRTVLAATELATALERSGEADVARAIVDTSRLLRDDLASLAPRARALQIPAAERWAREQNAYFVRALDVAFRELLLAGVRYVVALDVARLQPNTGEGAYRYGIGAGIQVSIVTFQVTMGYSFNPAPRPSESRGALFFVMELADLFR